MGEPWPPDTDDGPPRCHRCQTIVSHDYFRQWSDNEGVLDGCRACLPRSVRYGDDLYDRDPDEIEFDIQVESNPTPTEPPAHLQADDDE